MKNITFSDLFPSWNEQSTEARYALALLAVVARDCLEDPEILDSIKERFGTLGVESLESVVKGFPFPPYP